jgi:hypothetical protein
MNAPDGTRFLLGWNFGWADLMNAARTQARRTGRRQVVRRSLHSCYGMPEWTVLSAPQVEGA